MPSVGEALHDAEEISVDEDLRVSLESLVEVFLEEYPVALRVVEVQI
jgi:hypothetical protein